MDKLLILGGTNFIGRNLVNSLLLLSNYNITLFNRGKSNPHLFPKINVLYGDRNTSDINLIFKENWDYIIDLSCYYPNSLSTIISQLTNEPKRYIFISTSSVYDNEADKSILKKESSPTLSCSQDEKVDSSVSSYGKRKAECERIVKRSNLKYTILRPALVYGPYDTTDRFYYYLYHVKKENQLLIPNHGKNLFSVTYVKDLIQIILKSLNNNIDSDIYNVITYPYLSISKLINTASALLNKHPKAIFTNAEFLNKNNIKEWVDLPLWLNCDYFTYDNTKVINNLNVNFTDFTHSVFETIKYYDKLDWKEPHYGISVKTVEKLVAKFNNLIFNHDYTRLHKIRK